MSVRPLPITGACAPPDARSARRDRPLLDHGILVDTIGAAVAETV